MLHDKHFLHCFFTEAVECNVELLRRWISAYGSRFDPQPFHCHSDRCATGLVASVLCQLATIDSNRFCN